MSATLGRHDRAYWLDGLRATNPAQRLGAVFSASGLTIAAGSARAELRLATDGRGEAQHALPRVMPRAAANRLVYRRGGVDEWYVNGPLGLEQGFDVRVRPVAGTGALTLSLALRSNLRARTDNAGVVFSGHGVRWRYGGLTARDAMGRPLRLG